MTGSKTIIFFIAVFLFSAACSKKSNKGTLTNIQKAAQKAAKEPDADIPASEIDIGDGVSKPSSDDKQFNAFQSGNTCVDPELSLIPKSVTLTLCDGSLVKGTAEASTGNGSADPVVISACTSSGQVGCLTSNEFQAVEFSEIDATKLQTGFSLNGVSGTAPLRPADCSASNAQGCVTNATFRSVEFSMLDAASLKLGYSLLGVEGTLVESGAPDCSATGELGCISVADFISIEKSVAPEYFLSENLEAHWSFSEASAGSGSVLRDDSSTNGNDFADLNLVPSVAGLLGLGADLTDGENEYFEISSANFDTSSKSFSISVWFKKVEGEDYQTIAAHWDDAGDRAGWFLGLVDNRVEFNITTDGNASNTREVASWGDIFTGQWYHLLVSYNYETGALKLFLDGGDETALNTDLPANTSIYYNAAVPIRVGRLFDANSPFDGHIDELSVWIGSALEVESAARLYNAGTPLNFSDF